MVIFRLIDCIRDLWRYVSEGQFGENSFPTEEVPGSLRPIKREKADKDIPNLYIGKVIDDGNMKCEVIAFEKDDFRIKILEINWGRLGTYMDLGTVYPLRLCYSGRGIQTWEVDPENMKRDTSQVILQWEEQLGWTWDLDM